MQQPSLLFESEGAVLLSVDDTCIPIPDARSGDIHYELYTWRLYILVLEILRELKGPVTYTQFKEDVERRQAIAVKEIGWRGEYVPDMTFATHVANSCHLNIIANRDTQVLVEMAKHGYIKMHDPSGSLSLGPSPGQSQTPHITEPPGLADVGMGYLMRRGYSQENAIKAMRRGICVGDDFEDEMKDRLDTYKALIDMKVDTDTAYRIVVYDSMDKVGYATTTYARALPPSD